MLPEGKFAIMLGTIATVFVIGLVSVFSVYIYYKQDAKFGDGFNIFKATGSGSQFKGLNKAMQ